MFLFKRLLVLLCLLCLAEAANAREQIRIVGSSTVYPFVTIAAEQFGMDAEYRTPIVESTGTGGGFKLFCSGIGDNFPDINNASRPITESEIKMCGEHGIHDPLELAIGFDGIVIANSRHATPFSLTKEQLFLALARDVPDAKGTLKPNPYKYWNDIDKSLPKQAILLYGPPPTSGTRDAFVELVMEEACVHNAAFEKAYPDKSDRKKHCGLMREDQVFVEAGEDDNLIVQKLLSNKNALGILGFAFYEENRHKIQATSIGGVVPSNKAIEDGSYGISRSLFVYFKKEHMGSVPGLATFARELISEGAIGNEGYLILNGLIAIPKEKRAEIEASVRALNP